MPATKPSADAPPLTIERVGRETIDVPIVGLTPLIMHNWSDKARRQMLEAQQGKKSMKEIRDPQADYEAAFYRIAREGRADAFGFPSLAFKSATVSAARYFGKSVTMTDLRQCLFIDGVLTKADPQRLVEIHGEPMLREDVVKVGISGRDLRYRPQFNEWACTLRVTYVTAKLAQESVLALIDAGGIGCGVGEWRPEKSGESGQYQIDETRPVEVIR